MSFDVQALPKEPVFMRVDDKIRCNDWAQWVIAVSSKQAQFSTYWPLLCRCAVAQQILQQINGEEKPVWFPLATLRWGAPCKDRSRGMSRLLGVDRGRMEASRGQQKRTDGCHNRLFWTESDHWKHRADNKKETTVVTTVVSWTESDH